MSVGSSNDSIAYAIEPHGETPNPNLLGTSTKIGDTMKQLDYANLLQTEWADQFHPSQTQQIKRGLKSGVDVTIYAEPEYDWLQMSALRLGLERGLDVTVYAKPELNYCQMFEILEGLLSGVDVTVYAKPEFHWAQMEELRIGLRQGLTVDVYANPEFDSFQMQQIRAELTSAAMQIHN